MERDNETIDTRVFNGISRTLQRFWMNPLFYYTPGDIIASLFYDMMAGAPKTLTFHDENFAMNSPLVHLNYPANFNYNEEKLLRGYNQEEFLTALDFKRKLEHIPVQRGKFDLAVLNPDFLRELRYQFREPNDFFNHAANGNLDLALSRKECNRNSFESEILYAFEINYFHPWQKKDSNPLKKAAQTNEKLRLASYHSRGNIRPVHLIFLTTGEEFKNPNEVLSFRELKDFVTLGTSGRFGKKPFYIPNGVLVLFICNNLTMQKKKSGILIHYIRPDTGWAAALMQKIRSVLPESKKSLQAA